VTAAGPLAQAVEACARGDAPAAAAHLLAAWQGQRVMDTANLLDALSRLLPRGDVDALAGRDPATQARWLEVANAGDPADVPRLIITLPEASTLDLTQRVRALSDRDDPRLAMAVAFLLFEAEPDTMLWRACLALCERANDLRLSGVLSVVGDKRGGTLKRQTTHTVRALGYPRPLAPGEVEPLQQLTTWLAERPPALALPRAPIEAALLAAILAAPEDDTPREVYADWLTDAGDARGELIRLQLREAAGRTSDTQRARIDDLLRLHRRRWLWPLVWRTQDVGFERGFPTRVLVDEAPWTLRGLVEHLPWVFLRAVRVRTPYELRVRELCASPLAARAEELIIEAPLDDHPMLAAQARLGGFRRVTLVPTPNP
jgi:uncharacterized protein (TIGR02996 family)